MKLDKRENVNLMRDCCIVREIECTQKNNDYLAQEFSELKEVIANSKNVNFEDLHKEFDDKASIRDFLYTMENFKKSTIKRSYYKKAVNAAKRHHLNNDSVNKQEFTEKLKNKFFDQNDIKTLKPKLSHDPKLFISEAAITALLSAGAFSLAFCGRGCGKTIEPTPTPIETTANPTSTPKATEEPITGIDNLDVNDENFYKYIVNDFKSLYADEYNSSTNSNISQDDFVVQVNEHQNYIYQIKVGNEYRYVTHGDYPSMIENYFENNYIQPEIIEDCESISVYSKDSNGKIEKCNDEFGNLTNKKLDSAVQVKNPETGDLEYVKLYDGNNPAGLINPKSNIQSPLSKMGNIADTLNLPANSENDKKILKESYINSVKEYKNSEKTNSDKQFEIEER